METINNDVFAITLTGIGEIMRLLKELLLYNRVSQYFNRNVSTFETFRSTLLAGRPIFSSPKHSILLSEEHSDRSAPKCFSEQLEALISSTDTTVKITARKILR